MKLEEEKTLKKRQEKFVFFFTTAYLKIKFNKKTAKSIQFFLSSTAVIKD